MLKKCQSKQLVLNLTVKGTAGESSPRHHDACPGMPLRQAQPLSGTLAAPAHVNVCSVYNFYTDVFNTTAKTTIGLIGNTASVANEAAHIAPLMQPNGNTPLSREMARNAALEAELAKAKAMIGNLQRTVNATRSSL